MAWPHGYAPGHRWVMRIFTQDGSDPADPATAPINGAAARTTHARICAIIHHPRTLGATPSADGVTAVNAVRGFATYNAGFRHRYHQTGLMSCEAKTVRGNTRAATSDRHASV